MPAPSEYDLVRAKDAQGNEYTTTRVAAQTAGSEILDKPATDRGGVVPTKTRLELKREDALFDPAGHTVADVVAYLDTADATEAARVLEAEAGGKARQGIASWSPAPTPDPTSDPATPAEPTVQTQEA